MPVFNLCMKIIRKNKAGMMVYIIVFLGIAVLISAASSRHPVVGSYTATKVDAAFFSEENTPLTAGLKQELSKSADFVELPDNPSSLQDALYFREVTYIVRIPKGFTAAFLKGGKVKIGRTTVPDSVYSTMVDMKIDRYLNTAALYVKGEPGITPEQLAAQLKRDMAQEAAVTVSAAQTSSNSDDTQQPFASTYFNYLAYVLPAVLIYGVSAVLDACSDESLRARNFCSPMKPRSYSVQILLGIAAFSVACWLILLLPCAFFDPAHFFSKATPYQLLNSFAFLLTAAGVSCLVGSLVKGKEAVSALANICSLGPCFLAGVFIPQKFLSDSVLKLASFTPAYWFVKANETVGGAAALSREVLSPVFGDIFVELVFAAAFFAVGLAVSRRRFRGA